ncbi:MAG TPA: tetratricopeptide repeat protein [Vicinamibacteria bacterium]|nr:tetratricopeptide repeat protein [Vicinamibacteria bacterium]
MKPGPVRGKSDYSLAEYLVKAKARELAEQALELNPNFSEAHVALGNIKRTYDRDWSGAEAEYRRALEIAPGNAAVVVGAARVAGAMGRVDEALEPSRHVAELDRTRRALRLLRRPAGRGRGSL